MDDLTLAEEALKKAQQALALMKAERNMSDPIDITTFEAEGKTYKMYFGNLAFRRAELALNKPFVKFDLEAMQELTILIWAGLLKYQPDIKIEDIDNIVDEVGYAPMGDLVAKAMTRAFPQAKVEENSTEGTALGNQEEIPQISGIGIVS